MSAERICYAVHNISCLQAERVCNALFIDFYLQQFS